MHTSTKNSEAPALQSHTQSTAAALGWFSICRGLTRLVLPRMVRRLSGVRLSARSIRLCGVRELANGIGMLEARDPAPWVWGRAAGDALDLAVLGSRGGSRGSARALLAFAAVGSLAAFSAALAARLNEESLQRSLVPRDSGNRGAPATTPNAERGTALGAFEAPPGMATPLASQPAPIERVDANPADPHLQLVSAMPSSPSVPELAVAPDFIDADEQASMQAWADKLSVTQEQLHEAIQSVGARASDVELHLKGTRSITNADRVDQASASKS